MSMKSKISSLVTRNAIRGVLGAANYASAKKPLEGLRKKSGAADLRLAFEHIFLEGHGARIFSVDVFPKEFSEIQARMFLEEVSLDKELACQSVFFNARVVELTECVHSIGAINHALLSENAEDFSNLCCEHTEKFGLSAVLARKIFFSRSSSLADRLTSRLDSAAAKFTSGKKNLLLAFYAEIFDWERDFIKTRRKYSGLFKYLNERGRMWHLLNHSVRAHPVNQAQTLQAYATWSGLDAVCYIEQMVQEATSVGDEKRAMALAAHIPDEVRTAWKNSFSSISVASISDLMPEQGGLFDYYLVRNISAWQECSSAIALMERIENNFADRFNGHFPCRQTELAQDFPDVIDIDSLISSRAANDSNFNTAGRDAWFFRTFALIHLFESLGEVDIEGGEKLLELLGSTVDVAGMLSPEEAKAVFKFNPHDKLASYLASAIQFDCIGNKRSEHAFRKCLQGVVLQKHGGDIVSFAKFLDGKSRHVSDHLFDRSSERMLTELFDLYPTSQNVFEAQIELLEWYGSTRNNAAAIERAKSNRLNLKLRQVRGSIDDTRIYVDPLKFSQWAVDYISSDLRRFSNLKEEISALRNVGGDISSPIAIAGNIRLEFLKMLDLTYREFCLNETYGVDSYVGRRIRHGTLVGVMVEEIQPQIAEIIDEFRVLNVRFSDFLSSWLQAFERDIVYFGDHILRVYDQRTRPKGVFSASIMSKSKRRAIEAIEESLLSQMQPQKPVTPVISLIYEYCWILLEQDLKLAREHASALEQRFVIDPSHHAEGQSSWVAPKISSSVRKINTLVSERFAQLRSWLHRPTSLSPSAALDQILEVVVGEIRDRRPGCNPQTKYYGNTSIDLFGHRFHALYDVLYVLVENAARYGKLGEPLECLVSNESEKDEETRYRIEIVSTLPPELRDLRLAGISEAMISDIGDAFVVEGKSGLRKARALVREYSEFEGLTWREDKGRVVMRIDLRYLNI